MVWAAAGQTGPATTFGAQCLQAAGRAMHSTGSSGPF